MVVFARVVDAGSFSGAARQLGLTPSAVSRQVARLEGVLRVRLLERTTRKLRLTEAGSAAFTRCQALVAAAREVMALSDSQSATPRGLVRVSMPKAFGRQVVHPLMPAFLARYPEVDVQLIITDRTVDLFEESIDLAIRITDVPPPGLAGRPLTSIRHLVCASSQYLAAHGTPAHPRDLVQHSCLYLGEDERDRHWRFQRGAEEATVRVSGRYVANHSEVRLDGARQHLGIASLPEFTAREALAKADLVTVLDDWEHKTDYAGTAWLLYPPNRFLAVKLRVWIDFLVAALGP
ncbi:transcriptional regulator, LysR family [Rhodoferax ferrireducens T118]|uniref:Transcriptional regulator, LysR family n=2 Tax=Rhodoferax ferrireducens TaxID=192843 RepID=Q21SD0_ALBFT|nr:transcriptional regulator, LysR family [Rhodoferax ferrireducens T118]